LKSGDVVVGVLAGALETKVRPAVVIASSTYLVERPDVLVGILTTKPPKTTTSKDYILMDWQLAGLRAKSCFRAYILTTHRSELTVIGHLSDRDWNHVKACVRAAFAS
jgi:PemK-like, MazF-like toxin of type II toxin-antitoxin system